MTILNNLPETLRFEGVKQKENPNLTQWPACFYEYVGYREAECGEHYLDGRTHPNMNLAYLAHNKSMLKRYIVKPTHYAKLIANFERGDAI